MTPALTPALLLKQYDCASFTDEGGISLNKTLREKLSRLSEKFSSPLRLSLPEFSTNNAAGIDGATHIKHSARYPFDKPKEVTLNLTLKSWAD